MNTFSLSPGETESPQISQTSVEKEIREMMETRGIIPPATILLDGQIHRFSTNGDKDDTAGWYIFFQDPIPAGAFGDWRTGSKDTFRAAIGRHYTEQEKAILSRSIDKATQVQALEKAKNQKEVARQVHNIWKNTPLAPLEHPYLVKKKVLPHGLHVDEKGRLILPLFDSSGVLVSLQYIDKDGKKRFQFEGQTKGAYLALQELDPAKRIVVAEGFATGASILEGTGDQVVIAFSSGNIEPVTGILRGKYPNTKITICADNDKNGTGFKAARKAAETHHASIVMPPVEGTDANDYAIQGGDLKALFSAITIKDLVTIEEFMRQPKPIRWLIKGWLPEHALAMLHGPSGSGKTFVVLDWILTICTGIGEWMGCKANQGDVIYLCGEGHIGLPMRIKAWAFVHNKEPAGNLYISPRAFDLDDQSQLQTIIQEIHGTGKKPKLIVIDTLNRFFSKDENSAKDARDFLKSCSTLMDEFDCTVVIVHHTGLSQDAQNRGRGSSAWKGALDVEIGIRQTKKGGLVLQQLKAKNTEANNPLSLKLQSLQIPEWFDEDGVPIQGAVIAEDDQETSNFSGQLEKDIEIFAQAWEMTGGVILGDSPYITSTSWKKYLMAERNLTENAAKQALKDNPKRLAGRLISQQVIRKYQEGFLVIDREFSERLLMEDNEH